MKRFLSFILLLVTINAGCMHATFADFFAGEKTQQVSMNHHGMVMGDMQNQDESCENISMNDCVEQTFDCCGNILDYAVFQTEDDEDFSSIDTCKYIDIAVNFSLSEINLIEQLNSPPYENHINKSRNQYFQLVGIIKNNA